MEEDNDKSENDVPLETITAETIAECQLDRIIATDPDIVDVEHYATALGTALDDCEDEAKKRALGLLASICQIHFKPEDPAEPYGPLLVLDGRRTMIPTDIQGDQTEQLAASLPHVEHVGFRARIADICWLNDRRNRPAAEISIRAYTDCVQGVLDGNLKHGFTENSGPNHVTPDLLRRAFQISKATKGKADYPDHLRTTSARLLEFSIERKDSIILWRMLELLQDFRVGDLTSYPTIAEDAVLNWPDIDLHSAKDILTQAVRGYRAQDKPEDENRAKLAIAELSVKIAETAGDSAMFVSQWLMTAIAELRNVSGPHARQRAEQLEARLRDARKDIHFELSAHSHEIDITELVNQSLSRVKGLSWGQVLREVALIAFSPNPEELKAEARKTMAEHPLLTLMVSTKIDEDGKTILRRPGVGEEEGDEALVLDKIADHLDNRRRLIVAGQLRPIRELIQSETTISERDFDVLCVNSPFVPPGYEGLFSLGFARFFQGDMISAGNILLPTIESSIRFILAQKGVESSKIESNLTQEDRALSTLLTHHREELVSVFGEAIVFEIDLNFNNRHGPALRHEHAHGKLSAGHFFGHDVFYACWFIFHLTCLPLMKIWDKIAAHIDTSAGADSNGSPSKN